MAAKKKPGAPGVVRQPLAPGAAVGYKPPFEGNPGYTPPGTRVPRPGDERRGGPVGGGRHDQRPVTPTKSYQLQQMATAARSLPRNKQDDYMAKHMKAAGIAVNLGSGKIANALGRVKPSKAMKPGKR